MSAAESKEFTCSQCKSDCRPHENNSLGVEIQEFSNESGWVGISKPYRCYCQARTALRLFAKDGISRRVYAALKPRSNAF